MKRTDRFDAAFDGQRQRRRRAGEIADPQTVKIIVAALITDIAYLNKVVAGVLEGVGEARIGLEAGGVVAVAAAQFAAGAGVEQRQLRVDGAAEATAQHLEAEALAGRDGDLVIVVVLVGRLADDDARRRDRLGGGASAVAFRLHDLRQIVYTKEP